GRPAADRGPAAFFRPRPDPGPQPQAATCPAAVVAGAGLHPLRGRPAGGGRAGGGPRRPGPARGLPGPARSRRVRAAVPAAGALPPGFVLVQYEDRYGPGAVAPHVVGYVRAADQVGVAGLEKAFDQDLRGRQAATLLVRYDAYRRPLDGFRIVTAGDPAGGHD